MIQKRSTPGVLAIDIHSFKQVSSYQWRQLEELYTVVYMERYEEDSSMLLWQGESGAAVTIPISRDIRKMAEQITREVLRLSGAGMEDLCVVSCDQDLVRALRGFSCTTVQSGEELSFQDAHMLPDCYAADEEVLIESLSRHQCMFPGEAAARGKKAVCPPAMTRLNSYGFRFPLYVCGRYFASDRTDVYTGMLREIASGKKMSLPLAKMLTSVVRWICKEQGIDAILSVPPKPGEVSKFSEIISSLSESQHLASMDHAVFCCRNYPPLWQLSKTERQEAVRDAFAARRGVDYTKRILVFDDVVTTGVTFEEMAQTLLSAGCGQMVFLALGITQKPL